MRAAERLTESTFSGDFRLDRLATLYVFHPLRQRLLVPSSQHIPILMYHSVSENTGKRVPAYYDIHTAPDVFARQMRFLHENYYRVINLDEVVSQIEPGEKAQQKSVAITFDDGYRDFYTNAFPLLAEYKFTATVFLPTAYIGQTAIQFKGKDCLTWDEVRRLQRMGIHFGSHTVSHPQLRSCKPEEVEAELRDSKRAIERELGIPVRSFSYPYAFPENSNRFRRMLRLCLESLGYTNGVSTILGTIQNPRDRYFLKRLPVSSGDDPGLFQAKLEGGYDWLHSIQRVTKIARARGL